MYCTLHIDDLCHNVVMGAEYTVIGIAVAHDVELPTAPGGSATIPVHLEVCFLFFFILFRVL